jgi:hypothetical protein
MVTVTANATPAIPALPLHLFVQAIQPRVTITTPVSGVVYQWYDAPSAGNLLAAGNSFTTTALSSNTNYYVQANVSGCTSNRTTQQYR